MTHKYKVGDKVKIHSLDWFENNCTNDVEYGYSRKRYYHKNRYGVNFSETFTFDMCSRTNQIVTIKELVFKDCSYNIEESDWTWQEWMFEDSRQIKLKLLKELF
jgi:hypothetical protein